MTSRLDNRGAFLWTVLLVLVCASPCAAESIAGTSHASSKLVALAAAKFPNLTRAERAMLWFADVDNVDRGEFAVAGISSNPDDPTNDPAQADQWDIQRQIRASLINWLCANPLAIEQMNHKGIAVLGARIAGTLDLSNLHVPLGLEMRRCAFKERIMLAASGLTYLDLDGSYTSEIDGTGIVVDSNIYLRNGFRASGEVYMLGAIVGGDFDAANGHFTHSRVEPQRWRQEFNVALDLEKIQVKGGVVLCCGFRADGGVWLMDAEIGRWLGLNGAKFMNPGNVALIAERATIGKDVLMGEGQVKSDLHWGPFQSSGVVDFKEATMNNLGVIGARFTGAASEPHGFFAEGMTVKSELFWEKVSLENGAILDLSGASTKLLIDDKESWPEPHKLFIDDFRYEDFGAQSPSDIRSRLHWIGLNAPRFNPQPFTQLAQVYRAVGKSDEANQVLIAREDARYASGGVIGAIVGGFLRSSIGYGHRPLLAIVWMLLVVLVGSAVIIVAKRAGVMRPTYPENAPLDSRYQLLHPLLYSLDVFLPFVNLHQEHYWWPDAEASGDCAVAKQNFRVRGSLVQYYLWLQIIAGWLLSAIFIAGVTGLIRND